MELINVSFFYYHRKMIPKIIHYCWLSEEEFPTLIKKCIASWKKHLPDYEFILWDKAKFDINSTIWTKQAYDHKKYAFASDYIRLYALYNYGGIYLDTDVEVLKTFDELLSLPYFIGNQQDNNIEAAVIGAKKESNWVLDCLKYYENKSFVSQNGKLNLKVLPEIMTNRIGKTYDFEILNNVNYNEMTSLFQRDKSFFLFPPKIFSPKNNETGKMVDNTHSSFTIHHFNHSWYPFKSKLRLRLAEILGLKLTDFIINLLLLRKIRKWID
ncbi:glycosyltransferase family 32 protein [Winogradskyella sp.]